MFVTGIVKIALKTEPETKRLVMRHSAGAPIEKCHVIDGWISSAVGARLNGVLHRGGGGAINLCKSHPAFMKKKLHAVSF